LTTRPQSPWAVVRRHSLHTAIDPASRYEYRCPASRQLKLNTARLPIAVRARFFSTFHWNV